jgi:hypothetical protein
LAIPLLRVKAIRPAVGAIWNLDQVLTGEWRALFSTLRGKVVADIGAADGEMG